MGAAKDRLRYAEMILAAKGIDNVDLYAELARAQQYFANQAPPMPMVQPMAQQSVEPNPESLNTPIGQPTGQPIGGANMIGMPPA